MTSTSATTDRPALPSTGQRVAAEALGTFLLVLVGCGTFVLTEEVVPTALAFGLAYGVALHALARVSAHLNPAVTVGSAVAGRTSWRDAGILAGAQVVGGILAALALFALLHGYEGFDAAGSMGQNFYGEEGNGYAAWAALLLELLVTALLVLVVLAAFDERRDERSAAPLVSGLALVALTLLALPMTGASLNPARSIGPALFAGPDPILQLWVFLLGPLLGGLAAGAAYPLLFGRAGTPVPGSGLRLSRPTHAATVSAGVSDPQATQQWSAEQSSSVQSSSEQPIIQDGWQWDPVAQEWKPAEQGWGAPVQSDPTQQQPWPGTGGDDGRTQIR